MNDPRFCEASWNRPIRRLFPGSKAQSITGIDQVLPLDSLLPRLRQWHAPNAEVFFLQDSGKRYAPPGLDPPVSERQQLAAAEVFRSHGFEEYEDIDKMGLDRVWGVMPSPTYFLKQSGQLTNYSGARGTGVRDLGHHIGLEATDSRDYSIPLAPGMVFTVEPKLYIPAKVRVCPICFAASSAGHAL